MKTQCLTYSMRSMSAHKSPDVEYCPQEKAAMQKRTKLDASAWAERNIFLAKGPCPGRYKNANNPALAGIMDVFSLHHVRKGVLRKGIQTGGTQGVHILVAREADYSNGNDNALIVMADEKSVKKISSNRLVPIFTESPDLKNLISANPDDTTMYSIKLTNNFRLDIGWATSEVSVSSESYRVLVLDEIAKYQQVENIEDMKGRTNTFENECKQWILSSPGMLGAPIDVEFDSSDVVMDYYPVCPHCDEGQVMIFENFTWPVEQSANEIRHKKSAGYTCQHCGVIWDENDRKKALLKAMDSGEYKGWKPRTMVERFRSVSMHFPSWISPFMSMSEVVAKWLEAKGKPDKLKKWYNTVAGEGYEAKSESAVTAEHLLKYRSELARNAVPPNTFKLCLLADTQQAGFYYQIWAYGYRPDVNMHMIRHGIVESFAHLEAFYQEEFEDCTGKKYRISNGLIDSGGTRRGWQKHSRTTQVYEWCSRIRQMMPIKGVPGRTGNLVSYSARETYPGTNKPIPGGLKLATLRVDVFKDDLERRLMIEPDDPGALSFHYEIDAPFAKHYTTEVKDAFGEWQHDRNKGRNDFSDCTVYALALLEMMPIPQMAPQKPKETPTAAANTRELPSWYQRRR